MLSRERWISASLGSLCRGESCWTGYGTNGRSLVLLRAVIASASLSAATSRIGVGLPCTRCVRWSFLTASEARICCHLKLRGGLGLEMAWACPRCTYLNQGGGADCGMCSLASPEPVVDSGPEWSCKTCTFLNHFVESACEMCNTARPELAELERNQPTDQNSRSAGKFKPLRACPRSNADKERSHDTADSNAEPAVPNDLHSFIKESDSISRKRKAAAVEDEEGLNASEMDGLRERPAAGEGEMSNSWLGELHTQRMARINNSMASSGWL